MITVGKGVLIIVKNNIQGQKFNKLLVVKETEQHIQKKDISNYLIKIPSKEEQEKIGIFFLKFDELIDTQRKKIEVLKKQKNGILQKMFV